MGCEKKRYQPNVSQFLSLCSGNYQLILQWLPQKAVQGNQWTITGGIGELTVSLIESTRYTQLIEISRSCISVDFAAQPKVLVRVYHDAQLAEVLTSQQIFKLLPVYDYPNPSMHQPDEKYQLNAFLGEILKIGHLETVNDPK